MIKQIHLLALLFALTGFAENKPDLSKTAPEEDPTELAIEWSRLQNRNGDAYLPNTDVAYSGWAKEIYENGQIRTLCEFKEGYMANIRQWQVNGIPVLEANFVKGKVNLDTNFNFLEYWENHCFDKTLTTWHPNGHKCKDFNFISGRKNGLQREWYENGQIQAKANFQNGIIEGNSTVWFENGQKRHEIHYKNGIKEGLASEWYENGQIKTQGNFKSGKPEGSWSSWHENGQIQARANFKNGKPQGPWSLWYENGQRGMEVEFKKGNLTNFAKTWYENGQVESETNYSSNLRNGLATLWLKNGKLEENATYQLGIVHKGFFYKWHENGLKKSETQFIDGNSNRIEKTWYENGQIKSDSNHKEDQLHGLSTLWHEGGAKMEATNYRKGNKHGESFFWNNKDQIIKKLLFENGSEINSSEFGWHTNGKKKFEKNFKHRVADGVHIQWHPDGQKWIEKYYKNNILFEQTNYSSVSDISKILTDKEPLSLRHKVAGSDQFYEFSINEDNKTCSFTFSNGPGNKGHTLNFYISETKPDRSKSIFNYFEISKQDLHYYLLPEGFFEISNEKYSYRGSFKRGVPVGSHEMLNSEGMVLNLEFMKKNSSSPLNAKISGNLGGNFFAGNINFSESPTFTGLVGRSKGASEQYYYDKNSMTKIILGFRSNPRKIISRLKNPANYLLTDFHDNGEIKGKINFSDGALHGKTEFFSDSGVKVIEENYFKGRRHGITKIFHSSGNLMCEANYKHGKITDPVSAFYESGDTYNPKSGFLSTKYSLKFSDKSTWRSGYFNGGMPSGKQLEFHRDGTQVQSFSEVESLSEHDEYYGIFENRLDPRASNPPSPRDYNEFKKRDFYRISPGYRYDLEKLNTVYKCFAFLELVWPHITQIAPSIIQVHTWPTKGFDIIEPPITSTRPIISYTIRSGDTLFSIAHKFETTIAAIRTANHDTSLEGKLRVGQQIMIP